MAVHEVVSRKKISKTKTTNMGRSGGSKKTGMKRGRKR